MSDITHNPYLILGSGSPRRRQLLTDAGYDFVVELRPIDENIPPHIAASQAAVHLAEQKARAFQTFLPPNAVLLTADTVVILDNQILGKPTDADQAAQMLRQLSGRQHRVDTGVCICRASGQTRVFEDTTLVWFRTLSDQEIDFYVRHYAPYDKAGGYGAQDWLGMIGIEKLEGSYYNVMGLPIHKLYQELQNFIPFNFDR